MFPVVHTSPTFLSALATQYTCLPSEDCCKIPGAITLVVPGFLRLKEWAYAGVVFELGAAAVSQAINGHRHEIVAPAVLLGLALTSLGASAAKPCLLGGDLTKTRNGSVTTTSRRSVPNPVG
jgi:DoxX-like family